MQLVQEMQHSKLSKSEDGTLFGAKITGGGSGGTVCVIGRNSLQTSQQILEVILSKQFFVSFNSSTSHHTRRALLVSFLPFFSIFWWVRQDKQTP